MYLAVKNFIASDFCSSQIGPMVNTTFAVHPDRPSTAHFVSVPLPGWNLAHFTGLPQVAGWYPLDISNYASCVDKNTRTGVAFFQGFPSSIAQTQIVGTVT